MINRLVLSGLLAGASMAALAQSSVSDAERAAQRYRDPEARFQHMDRDNSGGISFEEFRNAMSRRFGRLDRDGNGVLAGDELRRYHGPNGDHSLTLAEYQDSLPGIFSARDANGDGAISLEEMLAARQARIEAEQAE